MLRLLSGLLLMALLAPLASADEAALRRLGERLGPMQSLRASFAQTVVDEAGKTLQNSKGSLAVKRADRLRWETTEPFAYLIVTDGKVLWRYDRDLEQVNRQPFNGELAAAPALIFGGDMARIGASYEVTWQQRDGDLFTLVPKQSNALFRSLTLHFKGNTVQSLELLDNLGQRTDIRFSEVRVNPAIADTEFTFTPPPGADVISDEP